MQDEWATDTNGVKTKFKVVLKKSEDSGPA